MSGTIFIMRELGLAGLIGSVLASHAAAFDVGVDEMKAQAEETMQMLTQAQSAATGGNSYMTTIIAVIVLGIVMLGAVVIWARVRNRDSMSDEAAETPLFEDQYAIRDEDISIETGEPATAFDDTVGTDSEEEPQPAMAAMAHADADAPALEHESVETLTSHEEPVLSAKNEHDSAPAEAADEASDTHDEAHGDAHHAEPTFSDRNENVIPLIKRHEEAAHDQKAEQEQPDQDHLVADAETDDGDDDLTYTAGSDHDRQEDEVRYAFAARQQGPMAFSGITPDTDKNTETRTGSVSARHTDTGHRQAEGFDTEKSHADDSQNDDFHYRRSYIAPTVLREDFSRLERLQAERFDILRDEMTRQISSLKSDQNNRFDIVVDALDRKLARLTEIRFEAPAEGDSSIAPMLNEFTRQVNMLQSTLENQGQRIRAITQILDDRLGTVSHVYGEVRTIGDKIDKFNDRISEMEKSISENTRMDMMADVQLSDVVRSSLPPDFYEFKPLLSNNHRADCVIRLPHPPGTIVVDTRFPLDAFNALPSRDEVQRDMHQARGTEDSFRRAVLRHIIDVAERFIIPGETADSALMFVPTESIYTTLHSRFPDLIRDAFRARVWIVSPSTLMGTLQTLRGVLRDARAGETAARQAEENESLRAEMEDLRSRASTLARNFETTQSELRAILEATDRVFSRSPKSAGGNGNGNGNGNRNGNGHRREHLVNELYDRKSEWPGGTGASRDDEKRTASVYEEFSRRPDPLR